MAEKRGPKKEIKKFTDLNDIFEHNTKESLWLLIDNKVYDVTNFKHPGGKQILLQNAGQDATTQFEDISHSEKADEYMKDLHIGDFVPEDDGANSAGGILGNEKDKADSGDDTMSRALLGICIIGLIIFLYTQLGCCLHGHDSVLGDHHDCEHGHDHSHDHAHDEIHTE